MPVSNLQLAANRANATLSTGPKTPEGKAAAAKNALSHGMCSAVLTIFYWENQADFDQLRDQYILRFQPIDRPERDLVDRLIDSTWRRNRMLSIETTLLDLEISAMGDHVQQAFPLEEANDGLLRVTLAFRERLGDRTWESIQRYIASTERSYRHAMTDLKTLQRDRFNASEATLISSSAAIAKSDAEAAAASAAAAPTTADTEAPGTKAIHMVKERTQFEKPEPQQQPSIGPESTNPPSQPPQSEQGSDPNAIPQLGKSR